MHISFKYYHFFFFSKMHGKTDRIQIFAEINHFTFVIKRSYSLRDYSYCLSVLLGITKIWLIMKEF